MNRFVIAICSSLASCVPYVGQVEVDGVSIATRLGTVDSASTAPVAASIEVVVDPGISGLVSTNDVVHLSAVRLTAIALRTERPAELQEPGGPSNAEIDDLSLVGPCVPGQVAMDFVDSIDFYIQRGDDVSSRHWVAHADNAYASPCGLTLTGVILSVDAPTDATNPVSVFGLASGLDNARFVVDLHGRTPSAEVSFVASLQVDVVLAR